MSRNDNDITGINPGTESAFGALLFAGGGQVVTTVNGGGQNGSSGGGGSGNSGSGGNGGSGGSNGLPGNQPFGLGQGDYTASLALFTENLLGAGAGGAAGTSTHSGGGGGGGILINGLGPNAGNGLAIFSAHGGAGYGAGGGAGGYDYYFGDLRAGGGNGADGLVYIEFQSVSVVPEPSSLALAGLGGLGLAFKAHRRRKHSSV